MNIYISFFSPPKKYSPAQPRCGEGGERGGGAVRKAGQRRKSLCGCPSEIHTSLEPYNSRIQPTKKKHRSSKRSGYRRSI